MIENIWIKINILELWLLLLCQRYCYCGIYCLAASFSAQPLAETDVRLTTLESKMQL